MRYYEGQAPPPTSNKGAAGTEQSPAGCEYCPEGDFPDPDVMASFEAMLHENANSKLRPCQECIQRFRRWRHPKVDEAGPPCALSSDSCPDSSKPSTSPAPAAQQSRLWSHDDNKTVGPSCSQSSAGTQHSTPSCGSSEALATPLATSTSGSAPSTQHPVASCSGAHACDGSEASAHHHVGGPAEGGLGIGNEAGPGYFRAFEATEVIQIERYDNGWPRSVTSYFTQLKPTSEVLSMAYVKASPTFKSNLVGMMMRRAQARAAACSVTPGPNVGQDGQATGAALAAQPSSLPSPTANGPPNSRQAITLLTGAAPRPFVAQYVDDASQGIRLVSTQTPSASGPEGGVACSTTQWGTREGTGSTMVQFCTDHHLYSDPLAHMLPVTAVRTTVRSWSDVDVPYHPHAAHCAGISAPPSAATQPDRAATGSGREGRGKRKMTPGP